MRVTCRGRAGLAAAGGVLCLVLPLGSASAGAAGSTPVDCLTTTPDDTEVVTRTAEVSRPMVDLDIAAAQRLAPGGPAHAGAGVTVAVLDSGIAPSAALPDVIRGGALAGKDLNYYHGTVVAGLIGARASAGGPIGVAPGARLVDVRVYDTPTPVEGQPDEVPLTAGSLADGLDWVADHAKDLHIRVVNISLGVGRSAELARAVERVHDAKVVIVAAAGNRPTEGEFLYDEYPSPSPGQDAVHDVWPAGFDTRVIAVSATAPGGNPGDYVLPNSTTDVAAPSAGALSVAMNGSLCRLPSDAVYTSFATAEVSGLVALLVQRYPHESPDQIRARLLGTATGSPERPTRFVGAGVVQPVEALTRPLQPDRQGRYAEARFASPEPRPAAAPVDERDPLAHTRRALVWAGVTGGAAVVLALLLRPLLARRRD